MYLCMLNLHVAFSDVLEIQNIPTKRWSCYRIIFIALLFPSLFKITISVPFTDHPYPTQAHGARDEEKRRGKEIQREFLVAFSILVLAVIGEPFPVQLQQILFVFQQ